MFGMILQKSLVSDGRLNILFAEEMGFGNFQLSQRVQFRRIVTVADLFPGGDGILVEPFFIKLFPFLKVKSSIFLHRNNFRRACRNEKKCQDKKRNDGFVHSD